MPKEWGNDLTILVVSDFNFLPGVYALFNSAIKNGFAGKMRIIKMDDFDNAKIFAHPQLEIDLLDKRPGNFHYNVQRWNYFKKLTQGKYLFLDADVIIERPIGFLLDLLESSILVSKEKEPKYDSADVLYHRQAYKAGFTPFENKEFGYINGGLIGFSLPAHRAFVDQLVDQSYANLEHFLNYTDDPDWFFIDQDMLNVVLRNVSIPVSVISPRLLEIGCDNKAFYKRKFPSTEQTGLQPKDQLKYIIHGAAHRRPWINTYPKNAKGKIRRSLYQHGVNGLFKAPTPYERAWAYYACSEDLPIPPSHWSEAYRFSAHKNYFWKKVHNLS